MSRVESEIKKLKALETQTESVCREERDKFAEEMKNKLGPSMLKELSDIQATEDERKPVQKGEKHRIWREFVRRLKHTIG